MPIIISYTTEQEWLDLRKADITSTEVSCLFNESPYSTEFELWHRKHGGLTVDFEENERMKWGKRYEAPTAEGLAEDNGWKIKPLKVYMRHDVCLGMGSSFDYEVEVNGRKGILEIKCVDYREFKSKWIDDGDFSEAPIHIELQLQHQLEVANVDFGIIAAMIGGNKPVIVFRERDRNLGALMCKKISTFWRTIKDGIEPHPDFEKDAETIKQLYKNASGSAIDLSKSNRFAELISHYQTQAEIESSAKKAKDIAKAEMLIMMKESPSAKCGIYTVDAKEVQRKGYVVNETKYRSFSIKQPKTTKGE